ncbi:cysteine-rich PDZ-binding protein [Nephila pilipes]|uniref:Cysteine-rich PDZ-binding protein n=1 Tax=Nephila pilipes TaxID=299642 RepID=A0A8X6I9P4_NEPPI|nr:cysteine-rich PDZ-binding protein [Nephila pilipes]
MVCDKCEKKLGKVITPDPWKSGARNTTEGGGRKINENKALTANKARISNNPSVVFPLHSSILSQFGSESSEMT